MTPNELHLHAVEVDTELARLKEERRQRVRDQFKGGTKLWVAEAPVGQPSSGPVLILDVSHYGVDMDATVQAYIDMGYTVTEIITAAATVLSFEEYDR